MERYYYTVGAVPQPQYTTAPLMPQHHNQHPQAVGTSYFYPTAAPLTTWQQYPQTTWATPAGGHPLPLAGPATGPTATAPSVPSAVTPARTSWVSRPTTAPPAAVVSPRSQSAAHPDCPLDVFERSDQGPRATQEDSIAVKTLHGQVVLLGLFDGHAGAKASEYCKTHTLELAARFIGPDPVPSKCEDAVGYALRKTEADFLELARQQNLQDGTTAVLACIANGYIHVAHMGDSRAVVVKEGVPIAEELTKDHKASDPSEAARVRQAGGWVARDQGCDRVYPGGLAVSRAIGDLCAKEPIPAVSGTPEVKSFHITPEMKFLVLACDGVWDVVSPELCGSHLMGLNRAQEAAHALVDLSLDRGTTGNVSVVVVGLRPRNIRSRSRSLSSTPGPTGPSPSAASAASSRGSPRGFRASRVSRQLSYS